MPDDLPKPEFLSYNDIRDEVAQFVADFAIPPILPVDVETIADVKLKLDIVPVPGLRAARSIEGYLSADRTTIYVDETMSGGSIVHRHRFTIAHEIGHWYLHEELYDAAKGLGCESFADFINSIPEESWLWYEYQAKAFGGLLLVPSPELLIAHHEAIQEAATKGFKLDLSVEAHRLYAANWIGNRFQVSPHVITRRAVKDGIWPAAAS